MRLFTITNPLSKQIEQYDIDKILLRLDELEKKVKKLSTKKTKKEPIKGGE